MLKQKEEKNRWTRNMRATRTNLDSCVYERNRKKGTAQGNLKTIATLICSLTRSQEI